MGRLGHILVLVAALAVVAAAFIIDVDRAGIYLFGWKWRLHCALHALFDIKCAFCGLTRAFAFAAHGRFAEAFEMHLLWPVVFIAIALEIPYRLFWLFRGPAVLRKPLVRAHALLWLITLVAVFAAWIVYLLRTLL